MSLRKISIRQLLDDQGHALGLTLVAGSAGLERAVTVPRIQKPGLALAGYREQIHNDRLLSLGGTEVNYLRDAEPAGRLVAVDTVMSAKPACIVVTRGLEPPVELSDACERDGVPLIVSSLDSFDFISGVTRYLDDRLSPSTSVHAVLLDVLGVGILLLGKSGIGKSEAALELVVRGHRLVADDIVKIIRRSSGFVAGTGSSIIRHHMEIRGLGIINIKDLFGISAVREVKKIELVIELCEWNPNEEYDRLGTEELYYEVLGTRLPKLRVPVRPGRSISTIIEVAARNQLLKFMGHHSAREFQERLNRAIAGARPQDHGDTVE